MSEALYDFKWAYDRLYESQPKKETFKEFLIGFLLNSGDFEIIKDLIRQYPEVLD